ncbi:electron transfer flavoprotein subunit alpha, mitochondrial isoform X2 [Physcomitrium patens]|uniref:Electron transfer flavoprotein subunit alpha n=1 Tax=Physcomitrium patens TaxID=3218 RepID=A0A7I4F5F1_PHYPA|nr:electron transfer flavoprotein subunit alpha, mitochondrial-like isoform X2 [Physcomitrium patens]|eukprot:XP_024397108.1 electron transfer flavoprotein subunit alpha, mitochondrial-like isoform X2 [Physcomitrella patens]
MAVIRSATRKLLSSRCWLSTTLNVLHVRLASTLVVAEHDGGKLKDSSLSAIAAAGRLGESSTVSVLLGGTGSTLQQAASQASKAHPSITKVVVADMKKLDHDLAEPWAEVIVAAVRSDEYSHVVTASTSFGKNVLPRAAALLDVSPLSDVTRIIDEQTFVRPIYAGNAMSTVRYVGSGPCIFSIRPTSFAVSSALPREAEAPISALDTSGLNAEIIERSEWLGQQVQESERPELGSARVVVSGGRGLKSKENFEMLEKLADKLGGAVGASRAAVDGGYVPNDMQVGQTGKIVAPELYIAIGISGAIQHLAGMKDSKVIVAINKDPDSAIFQVADYGLAADLFDAVPELVEKLPEKQKFA